MQHQALLKLPVNVNMAADGTPRSLTSASEEYGACGSAMALQGPEHCQRKIGGLAIPTITTLPTTTRMIMVSPTDESQ
jgi:hypothetical protein